MRQLIALAGLALLINSEAFSETVPTLQIQSGASIVDVTLSDQGNGIWGISAPASYSLGGSSLTLDSVTLDVDPNVHYAVSANNDVNAADASFTPYTFTFTMPVSLVPGLYSVSSSAAGSLTDGGTDGVTLKPTGSGPIQQSFIGAADAGVDLLSSSITSPSGSFSAPFSATPASSTYLLGTSATQISVTTSFDLSGNDNATVSGRFDVNAAPEPASLPLAVIAAGAFAFLLIRTRRSRIEIPG
jgi:hypothetical protein